MEELMTPFTDEGVVEEPADSVFEWYISMWADYIYKVTVASVLFFISCPWAAFLWAPYYFNRRSSR